MTEESQDESKRMQIETIKSVEGKSIKVSKVRDYYQVFVDILKVENEHLHYKEHLWVMGIDFDGYVACVYSVALGGKSMVEVAVIDIFTTAVRYKSANVVIAQNHTSEKEPKPSEHDIDFTNKLYHRSKYLEINLLDHIIISRLSLVSEKDIYYSFLEKKCIEAFEQDITYQAVDDVKDILDEEKKEYGADQKEEGLAEGEKVGECNRNIEIAKSMLAANEDISKIAKYTELSIEEIDALRRTERN